MLNDIRPPQSTTLVWFFQVTVRTEVIMADRAGSAKHPLSVHQSVNPLYMFPTNFGTFDVPSSIDSLMYFTGRMPFAGSLVHVQWHSHATVTQGVSTLGATISRTAYIRQPTSYIRHPASYILR